MKNCKHASCGEVCKYPPKVKKRNKIHYFGDKRRQEYEIYYEKRDEYLSEHRYCECGCGRVATEIHHKKGKTGKLLYDKKYFMAVARPCHRKITDNSKWASKKKYTISKFKK